MFEYKQVVYDFKKMKNSTIVNGWTSKEAICQLMNIFVTLVKPRSKLKKKSEPNQIILSVCHRWIEDCLQVEIDPVIKLEESMRNGIVLAKLADWIAPGIVRKIFQVRFKMIQYLVIIQISHTCVQDTKLQFRHSDNINYFFDALKIARLPQIFWFELTDLYEKKNIPKVIYCIHALRYSRITDQSFMCSYAGYPFIVIYYPDAIQHQISKIYQVNYSSQVSFSTKQLSVQPYFTKNSPR